MKELAIVVATLSVAGFAPAVAAPAVTAADLTISVHGLLVIDEAAVLVGAKPTTAVYALIVDTSSPPPCADAGMYPKHEAGITIQEAEIELPGGTKVVATVNNPYVIPVNGHDVRIDTGKIGFGKPYDLTLLLDKSEFDLTSHSGGHLPTLDSAKYLKDGAGDFDATLTGRVRIHGADSVQAVEDSCAKSPRRFSIHDLDMPRCDDAPAATQFPVAEEVVFRQTGVSEVTISVLGRGLPVDKAEIYVVKPAVTGNCPFAIAVRNVMKKSAGTYLTVPVGPQCSGGPNPCPGGLEHYAAYRWFYGLVGYSGTACKPIPCRAKGPFGGFKCPIPTPTP